MQNNALRALMHGFDRGKLSFPENTNSVAFLNAEPADFAQLDVRQVKCEQPHRPLFLQLQRAGFSVDPVLLKQEENFDAAIILLTKHRRYNELLVSRALTMVRQGGRIMVAGTVKSGASSFERWLKEQVDSISGFAKFHSRISWFEHTKNNRFTALHHEPEILIAPQYETREGIFSAHDVDRGSQILASHFDAEIKGSVADFGAGWGYLSDQLLQKSEKVKSLDLYESDWRALQCCSSNVKNSRSVEITTHWLDLEAEAINRQYDWIIMNPPFHTGQNRREDLGQAFIFKASACLRRGGRLLMVANTKLPYEQVLNKAFFKVEKREQRDGFKIIEALK